MTNQCDVWALCGCVCVLKGLSEILRVKWLEVTLWIVQQFPPCLVCLPPHIPAPPHPFLFISCLSDLLLPPSHVLLPHSGVLWTQKLKTHQLRALSSKVLPFKPGAGLYIAMRAMPTARDFFLANFYPSGPFTFILSKISPELFLCWLWLVPVWACRGIK